MPKLMNKIMINGDRVFLRNFLISDVTQRYVDWLNDPEINKFLSIRGVKQDFESVEQYVLSYDGAANKLLLGFFDKSNGLHIGNVTLSSIEWKNDVSVIGISLGDKKYWGKGYASEALSLAVDFAFLQLKMHRIEAGISVNNLASQKLFEKVGFSREGTLKDREKFGDIYVDGIMYGLVNKQETRKNE